MKVKTFQYQLAVSQKREILKKLNNWLQAEPNRLFFTTCYKTRAVSVFVQYESPDLKDTYLYAMDQEADAVLNFVSGFLNLFNRDDLVFKIEEREKVGFSIFLQLGTKVSPDIEKEEIEVQIDEVQIDEVQIDEVQIDEVEKESEERSLEEIVVAATSSPISRAMEDVSEETSEGIKRASLPQLRIRPNVHIDKKALEEVKNTEEVHGGRKAVYDWERLEELFKKHEGSIAKIAKDLGCSGAAVRRQVEIKGFKK